LARQGAEALRRLHGKARIERAVRSMQSHPVLVRMRERARQFYGEVSLDA
jgi:hypothetical protein